MKTFIKRYRLFLLLALANVVIGLALPDIGKKSVELTTQNLLEMLAVIPPIFILLGLLDVWVDRATMMKYTGKGSGLKGILIAFLLGSAAAGPLYAAFPVAGVMLKKGSSLMNVFIFIGAWSTTKIPMLTFEAASLGLPFMLVRLTLSIVGIFVIARITEKSLTLEQQSEVYKLNQAQ
ncbi:MAG: permease [Eubacteriales bacterium]|nr:permease [Eubacteriales bacterium]